VAVQVIPAVTAARSQLVVQAAIMQFELLQYAQAGPIQFVQEALGPATGHIPVTQVWAVFHILTVVTSATSVQLAAAAALCVMAMHGVVAVYNILVKAVQTAIFADSLDQILA
jgi:hypothetical protein